MNIEHRTSNAECRNSLFGTWHSALVPMLLCSCALMHFAGCESTGNRLSPTEEINNLKREKSELTRQIEHSKAENEQLKKQVQVLAGLKPDVEPEKLYNLQKVKVTKYTNLYDKDKDSKKEKLIIYIQPIDEEGDIIKVAGAVDVQLWNLNKKDGQALLGQWHVKPNELRKLWFATLVTINYRLMFDVADKIKSFEEPLTVKVTFTDYLTGKIFKEQKVIKP